jgi:NitT/TauT family transport system permease protein
VRRLAVLGLLAALWELAAIWQNNPVMLPRLSSTLIALAEAARSQRLLGAAWVSISVLLKGYALALAIALALVALAAANRFARDALQTVTAMLNPLPAIALLPFALAALSGFEAARADPWHRLMLALAAEIRLVRP